jgi:hypothetical protein
MFVYKYKNEKIIKVECEEMKYPLLDKDGDTIFQNSHFATIEEAYAHAIRDLEAGISLFTKNIIRLKEQIDNEKDSLTNECIALAKIKQELLLTESN